VPHLPAISCLGAFPTPASECVAGPGHCRRPKTCTQADVRASPNSAFRIGLRDRKVGRLRLAECLQGQRWNFRPGRSREVAAHPGGGTRLRFTSIAMRARCASLVAFRMMWSETEGAGKDRPPHMNVEAKPAFASRNIEIEAAVAEVQVPRWVESMVPSTCQSLCAPTPKPPTSP
jgi:hypothetical protein